MQKHKLLAIALLTIVAISGFLAGQQTASNNSLENAMHVELYIYKNNQLIYYDPDDPATKQLAMLIAEIIAGDINAGIADTAGNVNNDKITDTNKPGYVFVNYDSTYTYSYTLANLPSAYDYGQISTGGLSYDDASKSITLSATVNVNQTGTIYGVGLYTSLFSYENGLQNYLLFYDELSTPINVTAGDVVTITYKIVLP